MPKTKEEKREYDKKYYEANKEKRKERAKKYNEANKEKRKEYMKKYQEENKERLKEQKKEYRQANKEHIKEQRKKYLEANKEKRNEYVKKHREENLERFKKPETIKNWKKSGVVHDNFDALYDKYLNCEKCENCGFEFGTYGDGTGTFKCLDHCHETGAFRNFLCCACNVRRK